MKIVINYRNFPFFLTFLHFKKPVDYSFSTDFLTSVASPYIREQIQFGFFGLNDDKNHKNFFEGQFRQGWRGTDIYLDLLRLRNKVPKKKSG